MCGIVGLLLKKPDDRPKLGGLMAPMFDCMAERGADSGGCAVFGQPTQVGLRRFNLFAPDRDFDWPAWADGLSQSLGEAAGETTLHQVMSNHATLISPAEPSCIRDYIRNGQPPVHLLCVGRQMDLFKDMGDPRELAERYRFADFEASHCVGHTRMATESAVTPVHAHPFAAGEDFCLVHNGSLSNPYMLRRMLERQGLTFETDNDTEAACRYIEWRMRQGETVAQAIEQAFGELDGFYTLVIGTADHLTLVRDAFACKPAVVAETENYVAISSEYRSLAHLPGISAASIFEPQPEVIYSWPV